MKSLISLIIFILFSSCNEPDTQNTIQIINGLLKVESVQKDLYTISFTNSSTHDVLLPAVNPTVPVLKIEYLTKEGWVLDHMKSSMVKTKFRVKSREIAILKQRIIKQKGVEYRLSVFIEDESTKLKYKSSVDI